MFRPTDCPLMNIVLAPTEVTLHDFIRMIWQLRIQSIIMLTRLFEDGKVNKQRICLGN